MSESIIVQVVEQLENLPDKLQHQVLEFARSLQISPSRGVHGSQLVQFAGLISPDDLNLIERSIESGCEQVDLNEW